MARRYYVFGQYRLDPVARTVLRDDKPLALTPKAVETLALLVENSRSVVPKETLLNQVWAGAFVGDGSLMRNISDLRKMFAENGGANYIDTIPRRGYRFNADVRVESVEKLRRRSVVFLPLRLLAGEGRDAAMASAVVEATITKVSAVRECAVQSSGMLARQPDDDPVAIGRELGADFVLDGSIRRKGHKGRVSVRLLSTADGAAVWSETLEERCDDAFAFEDAISDELAGALALILTNAERKLLVRRYTENTAAYRTYLEGRLHWALRSQEELYRAINCFRRAIDIDPSYALAYSGLACSYAFLPMLAPVSSGSCMPRAKTAALHALEIDDTLLEARSVLAFVAWHYDWKWKGAERELRRMLKFEPGDAVSHAWYALLLAERGRFSDAVAEARRAQRLDARSDSVRANVATVLYFCGRYDEAIEEAAEARAANPASLRALFILGVAHEQHGRLAEAVAAFETAVKISRGMNPFMLGALGHACARSHENDAAERALNALDKLDPEVTCLAKALVRLGMNDHAEALRLIRCACDSREFGLVTLGVDPRFAPLRQSVDFRELLGRVGLDG